MASDSLPLVDSKYLETTPTTQYTSTTVTSKIDKCVASNNSVGTIVLEIYLVPPSGSYGNSNLFVNRSVLPGRSDLCPEITGTTLAPGGSIVANCNSASAMSFKVDGRIIS